MPLRFPATILLLAAPGILFAAERILVVNKGSNNITDLNTESSELIHTSVGYNPHEIAVSDKFAYVSNFGINHIRSHRQSDKAGKTISVYDLKSNSIIEHIDLGEPPCAPHGLHYSPNSKTLYVTCEARYQLVAIDTITNHVKFSVATNQPGSHMLVVDKLDRFAYIANFWIGTVSVVDLTKKELVKQLKVGRGIEGITMDAANNYLYVSNVESNEIAKIDLANLDTRIHKVSTVGESPIRVHIPNGSEYLFVNTSQTDSVDIYTLDTLEFVKSIPVGRQPIGFTSSADGEYYYAANMRDATISVIDTNLLEVERTIVLDQSLPDGIATIRLR